MSEQPATTMIDEDGIGVIRVEDVFDTDPADLWEAITDPQRLARWIAEAEGDLTLGGEFRVRFTSSWEGPARVQECQPPRRLVLAMAPGTDEAMTIEATLSPEAGGTRLVVEDRGLPLEDLPFHGAGWQVHLEDLGSHLRGQEAAPWKPRWEERLPQFQAEFNAQSGAGALRT